MVAELVRKGFLLPGKYLLKDGSLEYQVHGITSQTTLMSFGFYSTIALRVKMQSKPWPKNRNTYEVWRSSLRKVGVILLSSVIGADKLLIHPSKIRTQVYTTCVRILIIAHQYSRRDRLIS